MAWPWNPTHIPLVEDHPRLWYGTLKRAHAFERGATTYWGWNTPAAALAIRVTGDRDGFTIFDGRSEVRVVRHGQFLICPKCERTACRYLLFREGWHCQVCSGCDWASRHRFRTIPLLRRQRLLRQLAQRSVVNSRDRKLRYQLAEVEQQIVEKIRDVHRRACSRHRRRAGS